MSLVRSGRGVAGLSKKAQSRIKNANDARALVQAVSRSSRAGGDQAVELANGQRLRIRSENAKTPSRTKKAS